jgi:ABC-type multidrug transport system permease subunit
MTGPGTRSARHRSPHPAATAVRAVAAGAQMETKLAGISPLAIMSSSLTPVAYGVVVTAGVGEPNASLLLGTVAAGIWGTLQVSAAVTVTQERSWQTLQLVAASPVPLAGPLVGRMLAATAQALLAVPATVAIIGLLFGGFGEVAWGRSLIALAVLTAGLLGMSLFLMGALTRFRYSAGMVNGLFGVVLLLGGFFVPLQALPRPFQVAGYTLPAPWAIDAARAVNPQPWRSLLVGTVVSLAWLAAGVLYVTRAERRLRRSPSAYSH